MMVSALPSGICNLTDCGWRLLFRHASPRAEARLAPQK